MQKLLKPWKPQYVKRNTIIQIVLVALTFIMLASIWPYQNYHNHDWVKQQAFDSKHDTVSGKLFAKEDKKLQTVIFTKEHLYQMRVYLDAVTFDNKDYVLFRLYDDNFSCIYDEDFGCNLIKRDGYVQPVIDMDVVPGKLYYYEIIVPEKSYFWWMYTVEIIVPTAPVAALGIPENGPLYIDGIYNDQEALIADFDYGTAMKWWQIVGYDILVIILAFALYICILFVLDKTEPYYEKLEKLSKIGVGIVSAIVFLAYLYFVLIAKKFGTNITDLIVFALGGCVAIAWLWTKLFLVGKGKKEGLHVLKNGKTASNQVVISLIWRNAIQIVSFGLLFLALSMYVNADVEYLHTNNTRWLLILMGIAMLAIPTPRIFMKKINYFWGAASLIGGILYVMQQEASQDRYLAKLTVAVVIIWGFVILQIFFRNKKDLWKNLEKPYFFVWIGFIVCTYIYRFEKTWVFTASIPFLILLLYNLKAEEKKRLLENFSQGILFSFWLMTLYNLLHRPHHYWIFYRYSGMFHTVACTGLYLSVVIGTAFAVLLGKWKNRRDIWNVGFYELFTLIVSIQYVFLSMSRTALLAVIITLIIVMLLSVWIYQKSFTRLCKEGFSLLGILVMTFPLVFSCQRIVPAIVNKPEYFRIENTDRDFVVHEGEALDSDKYMTVERFVEMLTGRVHNGSADGNISMEDNFMEAQKLLVSIQNDTLPIALSISEEENTEEVSTDISNGRIDIFKLYLSKVSWRGNAGTLLKDVNGEEYAHAHNSVIMVFYNFGIIAGILFVILCVWTFIRVVSSFRKKGTKSGVYLVPISLIIIFTVTGLTEWTFHPCFTTGYVFLFVLTLYMKNE